MSKYRVDIVRRLAQRWATEYGGGLSRSVLTAVVNSDELLMLADFAVSALEALDEVEMSTVYPRTVPGADFVSLDDILATIGRKMSDLGWP